MEATGEITRAYAMLRATDLRRIARDLDGGADYANVRREDGPESIAQRLRQAAFVIEMTAPPERVDG